MKRIVLALLAAALAAYPASIGSAPAAAVPHAHSTGVRCEPVGTNEGQLGCWILGDLAVAVTPGVPLFWHIYEYPSATEAERAGDAHAQTVNAYGRTWLLAVAGQEWRANGARKIAVIGPLVPLSTAPHRATFMEAAFEPGMRSAVHSHPGPEAWMVLDGEQCLETPEGVARGGKGETMMVRGGIPMALYGTGTATRRALVLILHPSDQPPTMPRTDWQPKAKCLAG